MTRDEAGQERGCHEELVGFTKESEFLILRVMKTICVV